MTIQHTPYDSQAPLQIGFGVIRHARLKPRVNEFAYRGYFLRLRMDALEQSKLTVPQGFSLNRWNWLSFYDTDHGIGDGFSARWARQLLSQSGIHDCDGALWLHSFARVLGYAFKPVSFWFCHRADGQLRAIIAEVNNTFGERHCYVLDNADGAAITQGQLLRARKVFHVSPFCQVRGQYEFRFMLTTPDAADQLPRWVARIDYHDEHGPLLNTSQSGQLQILDSAAARRAVMNYPLFTMAVIARIHWQAVKLWLGKRIPFISKPAPPSEPFTRAIHGTHDASDSLQHLR